MANDTGVALFAALLLAVGIIISAAAASTHGSAATIYTNVLIGFRCIDHSHFCTQRIHRQRQIENPKISSLENVTAIFVEITRRV